MGGRGPALDQVQEKARGRLAEIPQGLAHALAESVSSFRRSSATELDFWDLGATAPFLGEADRNARQAGEEGSR